MERRRTTTNAHVHVRRLADLAVVTRGVSPVMSKPWKCRLGLHSFVRRSGSPDPNEQVCVRCRKHRINTYVGGLLSRFGG